MATCNTRRTKNGTKSYTQRHQEAYTVGHNGRPRGQHFKYFKCQQSGTNPRETQRDITQSQILCSPQHHKEIMKTEPNSPRKSVFSSQSTTKMQSTEDRNIRLLIDQQRRDNKAKLIKRDAIISVQADFFYALEKLYTWPLNQLTFGQTKEVREFWSSYLHEAQRCAYRAENIDPNHYDHLRYDIMCEIVKLETLRLDEFLSKFDHFRQLIYTDDITEADENYCDDTMLSFFYQVQTNVILNLMPIWIAESKRPPLTWYGSLTMDKCSFSTDLSDEERILVPE